MARIYAGILGPLALLTTIVHGMLHARQEDAILLTGWANLLVFAVIGAVIGWIAENAIEESVSTAVSITGDRITRHAGSAEQRQRGRTLGTPATATNRGKQTAGPPRAEQSGQPRRNSHGRAWGRHGGMHVNHRRSRRCGATLDRV